MVLIKPVRLYPGTLTIPQSETEIVRANLSQGSAPRQLLIHFSCTDPRQTLVHVPFKVLFLDMSLGSESHLLSL